MRLGLIARADNRGLGQQCWEFHRHMRPAKTLVVDCASQRPLPLHLDRYPGADIVHGVLTDRDCAEFLADLDAVYTAETPYNYALFTTARQVGARSVLHYNFEFLDHLHHTVAHPDVFAAPSTWRFDDVPFTNKTHLPVPVATDRFAGIRSDPDRATRYLHVVGRPAIHDRNGTADLIAALPFVRSQITLTITCQDPHYVPDLLRNHLVPDNITLTVHSRDVPNYWDLYHDQDALVLPRRFGGLCLPAQEAIAAGIPVIMPDISPNHDWLPAEWLVPAEHITTFAARTMIDVYGTDPRALAAQIDRFATDHAFYQQQRRTALITADRLSWDALKPRYSEALFAVACMNR